jgi:hypothetical protein
MSTLKFIGASTVASLIAISCVHDQPKKKLHRTSQSEESDKNLETSKETAAKAPPAGATQGTQLANGGQAAAPASPAQSEVRAPVAAEIVQRLSAPNTSLKDEDRQAAGDLAQRSQPGSIDEAALVLICLFESIPELSGKGQDFHEADLGGQGLNRPGQNPTSVESRSKQYGLDLASALEKNPFLQGYAVQTLALRSLDASSPTDEFRATVTGIVRTRFEAWSAIAEKVGAGQPSGVRIVDATAPQEPEAEAQEVQPALKFGGDGSGNDDMVLQEAQALADKGQYKQSVARLSQLKEDSPLFAAAQEKIRDASNKAVQELRRQAAKAFQSAIPVTDLKTKAEYLKEARKLLETALSAYPKADQLGTVRENLAVINRDLTRISENEGKR